MASLVYSSFIFGSIVPSVKLFPSSFFLNNIVNFAYSQEPAATDGNGEVPLCIDASTPDAATGLCSDGFPPLSNQSSQELQQNASEESLPLPPTEQAPASEQLTGGDLPALGEVPGKVVTESGDGQTPEEIQMDTNGDGVVDEADNLNQSGVTNGVTGGEVPNGIVQTPEEIQMDTNGDGIVDETESQNKAGVTNGSGSGTTSGGSPVNSTNYVWIHDPTASVLDKLKPSTLGEGYRNFKWKKFDYPGGNKRISTNDPKKPNYDPNPDPGPNEKKADEMFYNIKAQLIPERRVTAGGTAAFCVASDGRCGKTPEQVTETIWAFIKKALKPVDGVQLNEYAKESFLKMQAAAKKDGVELHPVVGYYSCDFSTSNSNSLPPGSQKVVAKCPNSHNFGLALDLKMNQADFPPKLTETGSAPFTNVVTMMQSPVYKWLYLNAKTYNWYPYVYEPWHWEYNPPGFRSQFFAGCNCDPKTPLSEPKS